MFDEDRNKIPHLIMRQMRHWETLDTSRAFAGSDGAFERRHWEANECPLSYRISCIKARRFCGDVCSKNRRVFAGRLAEK